MSTDYVKVSFATFAEDESEAANGNYGFEVPILTDPLNGRLWVGYNFQRESARLYIDLADGQTVKRLPFYPNYSYALLDPITEQSIQRGSDTQFVYFANGVPVASTENVGGPSGDDNNYYTPVYLKNGTITACAGTTVTTAAQTFSGNKTFNNNLTIKGTTKLNSSLTVKGNTALEGTLTVSGVIAPNATNTLSLGTSSKIWSNVYASNFIGALSGNATTATTLETPRNLNISDYSATNSGEAVAFNGGAAVTLKLPDTIKATSFVGNATTATTLATGRTIKVSLGSTTAATFDGSANITPGVSGTLSVTNGGTGTATAPVQGGIIYGASKKAFACSAKGSSGQLLQSNGTSAPSWITATNSNTASTIVKRDSSGNFSAGTITATLSGNASTASKLATARTITLSGDISGSANFDGSGNINISTSFVNMPLTTITKSLKVTSSWQNTGIVSSNLPTGTYIVQVSGINNGHCGLWGDIFSGVMSWYNGGTNGGDSDEIILHCAGHARNGGHLFLRTLRTTNNDGKTYLQIKALSDATAAQNVTFTFRRVI